VTSCDQLTSYDTFVLAGGFCIPTEKEAMKAVGALFSGVNLESAIESVYVNRYVLLGCLIFAFALSYFFSLLLRYCTWLIVLISIIGVYALGIYISIVSWKKYTSIKSQQSSSTETDDLGYTARFYKWLSIVIWIVLALVSMITVCLFDRIKLAVNVIKAAAEFVTDETGVVLVPISIFLLNVLFVCGHVYGTAAIFSTGDVYHNPDYPWGKIRYNDNLK
jgi:solute carrier family 44 (choline transporter-like protein), member 2/4/5